MFYVKEDLDELAPIVNSIFGTQGTYVETIPQLKSLYVVSGHFGKLWYGDAPSLVWINEHCKQLKSLPMFEHDTLTVCQMADDRELLTF